MKYQKLFKDLAQNGEISGGPVSSYGGRQPEKNEYPTLSTLFVLLFIGLVLGALIYGLVNASQIEKVQRNQCLVVHDPTC